MKTTLAVSIALLLTAGWFDLQAQVQGTNRVSAELKEFLSREGVRDPETGAILSVRPKKPRFFDNPPLDCSMQKLPVTNQVNRYEIVLTVLQMNGIETHERIILEAEPALLAEVARQSQYVELAPRREQRKIEARSRRISEATKGLLSYGMKKDQVLTAKGDQWKAGPPYQKAGAFELHYADVTLLFDPILVDAWPPDEPPHDKRPAAVSLNRFVEGSKP